MNLVKLEGEMVSKIVKVKCFDITDSSSLVDLSDTMKEPRLGLSG